MTTICTIDEMIAMLEKMKEEGYTHTIMSRDLHGVYYGPSKKCDLYRIPVAIAGAAFKDKNPGNIGITDAAGTNGTDMGFYVVAVHESKLKNVNMPPDTPARKEAR